MAGGMLSEMAARQESAGVQALRLAKRKAVDHMASASKELGDIAAQYGRLIDTYQSEIRQIDDALATLVGSGPANDITKQCESRDPIGPLATTRLR